MSRYYLLILLIAVNILSYVDRHMLPAFATQISGDLELSRQQFGLLTGFAFVTVYAVCGPLMGILADRYNPSKLIAAGILLWSVMTFLTGLSKNFVQILLPRMGIGVGEATLHPAAASILGRLFSAERRATVFGLFFMGSHIGLGLAYWLAGNLGDVVPWREMFYFLGGLGVVMCLLLLATVRMVGSDTTEPSTAADPDKSIRAMLGDLVNAFRNNSNFRNAVIGLCVLHMVYASSQFTQLWLVGEKGLDASSASSLYGTLYLLCAIPASMFGGMAADYAVRRFAISKPLFVTLVILVCSPLLIMFRFSVPGTSLFYVYMASAVFILAFPYGAIISLVLDHAPDNIQATAIGFTMTLASVLIVGTGSWAIGYFGDLFETMGLSMPLTRSLLGADVFTILSAIFYFQLHRATRAVK